MENSGVGGGRVVSLDVRVAVDGLLLIVAGVLLSLANVLDTVVIVVVIVRLEFIEFVVLCVTVVLSVTVTVPVVAAVGLPAPAPAPAPVISCNKGSEAVVPTGELIAVNGTVGLVSCAMVFSCVCDCELAEWVLAPPCTFAL